MKTIKNVLSRDNNKIEIVPLSDLHVGEHASNMKAIKEVIAYIKDNDSVYCVLNGDLINNAIRMSVSDIYTETMNPADQVEMVVELLEPIKDKILAAVSGNHSARTYKVAGIDIDRLICQRLGIEDKYSPDTSIVFIKFGWNAKKKQPFSYSLYLAHNTSGGRKPGGKANRLADLSMIVDADCYIVGHSHAQLAFKKDFFRCNKAHQSVSQVTRLFVNSGAWLNYGGYGAYYGYAPSSISKTPITIEGFIGKQRISKVVSTCQI